jgi:hypothetical protein
MYENYFSRMGEGTMPIGNTREGFSWMGIIKLKKEHHQ